MRSEVLWHCRLTCNPLLHPLAHAPDVGAVHGLGYCELEPAPDLAGGWTLEEGVGLAAHPLQILSKSMRFPQMVLHSVNAEGIPSSTMLLR